MVLPLALAADGQPTQKPPYSTWSDYAGAADSMQYSSLTRITKDNVRQLEIAWFHPVPDRTGNFGFNPREFQPRGRGADGPPEVRGRGVYRQLCESCHGEPEPAGIRTMDRTGWIPVAKLGGDRLRARIREGQGQMPAFADDIISDADLRSLLAFLGDPADGGGGRGDGGPGNREVPGALSAQREGMTLFPGVRYTGPLGRAFRAGNGMTAIGPPWSEIVAYDLNEGVIKWRVPFGTSPALAARGITHTGNGRRVWRNGPAVTAGGLIFLGSWSDRTVRAFDKDTGKVLWEHALKANPEGLVSVFEAGGRQYVAFCASGSAATEMPIEQAFESRPGLASAQGYYVFALPRAPATTVDASGRKSGQPQ